MDDPTRAKQLEASFKNKVAQFLLVNSHNGKLRHGAQKEAEEAFGVTRKTLYRIWKLAKEQMANGEPIMMSSKIKGFQHKDKFVLDVAKVKTLSVLERSSIRKMAVKLDISKSLVSRWIKEKQIRPHTNAIKPILTQVNKLARLKWSLSHLGADLLQGQVKYQSMHNVVHIDEKWFYMTKCSDRYYLLPEEEKQIKEIHH